MSSKKFIPSGILWAGLLAWGSCLVACSTDVADGGVSEETNTLAGVLLDGDKPVANTIVTAQYTSVDTIQFVDTTDEKGAFKMPLRVYGTYALSSVSDTLAAYTTVNYQGTKREVNLSLSKALSFEGRLTLDDEEKVGGAELYLPGSPWTATADSVGHFELKNVPAGRFALFVNSPDPMRYVNAAYVIDLSEKDVSFAGPFPTSVVQSAVLGEVAERSDEDLELALPLSPEYGLISLWSMDYMSESDGVKYTMDSRGRMGKMVLYGMDELVKGYSGKALPLDSAKSFGVVEDDNGVLDSATAITLEVIIQIDSLDDSASYRRNVVGKLGFDENDKNVFSFALINKECGADEPAVAFFIADGSGDSLSCENAVVSKAHVDYGAWSNYAVTWNGTKLSLYKNGVLDAEKNVSVQMLEPSDEPVFFGKEDINVKLDDVRLGAKAISSADVLYRYYLRGGNL